MSLIDRARQLFVTRSGTEEKFLDMTWSFDTRRVSKPPEEAKKPSPFCGENLTSDSISHAVRALVCRSLVSRKKSTSG